MRKLTVLAALICALLSFPTQAQTPPDGGKPPVPPPVLATAKPAASPALAPVAAPVAVPAPAPAPVATASTTTTEEMPWWKVLIRYGLELVFAILGIMATAFVTVLMRKYGFEDYSAKVNDLLERGTGYAEQKSLNALKLNGKPLGSAEKLALALEMIGEKAKEYKLPEKGKEWWEKKVEGWLGSGKLANGK